MFCRVKGQAKGSLHVISGAALLEGALTLTIHFFECCLTGQHQLASGWPAHTSSPHYFKFDFPSLPPSFLVDFIFRSATHFPVDFIVLWARLYAKNVVIFRYIILVKQYLP
jgi:hypothetical protein